VNRPGSARCFRRAVLVGCTLVLLARGGLAAAPPPVVVVDGAAGDPVVARLALELRAAGFEVRSAADPDRAPGDAVLHVTPALVEIRFHVPGRPAQVEEEVGRDEGRESAALVAVRVTEIIRARLLPFDAPAPPPTPSPAAPGPPLPAPAPPAPPPSPAAPVLPVSSPPGAPLRDLPRPPRRFGVDAGPLVLASPGGVPASFGLLVSPRWSPGGGALVRALVAAPLTSPGISSGEGSAKVTTWFAGIAADARISPGDDWTFSLGAGLGAAWSRARGAANAPDVGASGDAVACVPFLEVGGARALGTPAVRLGVRGLGGIAVPGVAFRFAGREVASWGLPLGAASLALEVDVP
jgi:hypothetical protein